MGKAPEIAHIEYHPLRLGHAADAYVLQTYILVITIITNVDIPKPKGWSKLPIQGVVMPTCIFIRVLCCQRRHFRMRAVSHCRDKKAACIADTEMVYLIPSPAPPQSPFAPKFGRPLDLVAQVVLLH